MERARVLVVDGSDEPAALTTEALVGLGFEARRAASGYEAIAVAAEFAPHIALLEVALRDMSGITLANILRGVLDPRALRVVGVSAAGIETLRRASERGILDGFLLKPFSPAAIDAVLRATAGTSKAAP